MGTKLLKLGTKLLNYKNLEQNFKNGGKGIYVMKQNFKHENKTSKLGTKGISEMKKIRNRTFLIKNKASTLKTKIQTNFKIGRIFFF